MMMVVAVQMEMSPTGNQWNQLMAAAGSCQHLLSLCFQAGSTFSSQAASSSSSISFTSCQHSELQSLLPNLPNLPPSSPTISLPSPLFLQTWYLSPALGGEQKDDNCWRGGAGGGWEVIQIMTIADNPLWAPSSPKSPPNTIITITMGRPSIVGAAQARPGE